MGERHRIAGSKGFHSNRRKDTLERKKLTQLQAYEASPVCCAFCLAIIPYEKKRQKFCCHSCAAKMNNRQRAKSYKCVVCGIMTSHLLKERFCCRKCKSQEAYDNFIAKWQAGEIEGGTWQKVHPYVRRWLMKRCKEKCEQCAWSVRHTVTGRIPLQVDHIDGNPYNHKQNNLRVLCPNCHSLTATFGALNKGNGRKERKDTPL